MDQHVWLAGCMQGDILTSPVAAGAAEGDELITVSGAAPQLSPLTLALLVDSGW